MCTVRTSCDIVYGTVQDTNILYIHLKLTYCLYSTYCRFRFCMNSTVHVAVFDPVLADLHRRCAS